MNRNNFNYQDYDFCGLWLTMTKLKSIFQSILQWPQGTKCGFLKQQSEIQMYSHVFWSWEFSPCPSQTEEDRICALSPSRHSFILIVSYSHHCCFHILVLSEVGGFLRNSELGDHKYLVSTVKRLW